MANHTDRRHERWANLRFAIVGTLLAAPPSQGDLRGALEALAARTWQHPITGAQVSFAFSTIERWLHLARRASARADTVGALRRRVRKDAGQRRALSSALIAAAIVQHREHPSWSYQLHADNLVALAVVEPALGRVPSYTTVRRFMKERGLFRRKKIGRVANPYSNYLAMVAIDADHIAAYGGSKWDDTKDVDVGDCGRANAQIERKQWIFEVGEGTGVLAEIGGCGYADVYRFGHALVIPEHYTGEDDDADAEAAVERVAATHPTTKPTKLGTVDVTSGVLVLKGLFDPGAKIARAKVKKAPQTLSDGFALAVPVGKYDVWREQFKKGNRCTDPVLA